MNSETIINPQFTVSIASGLRHWQKQTAKMDEAAIIRLDAQRQNLMRIVSYAQKLAPTQQAAAEVALQAFPLVERRGYWQEWIPLLKSAADHMHDDLVLQAKLLNRLGELYRHSRQLLAAIKTHLQAEAAITQADDAHLCHRIWLSLSTDYYQIRDYDLAEQYGRQALTGFRTTDAPLKSHAAVLNTLGMVAWARGQLDDAETLLRQAAALWRKIDQPTELLRTLNNLMGTLRSAKKYEDVYCCYEEAAANFSHTASEFEKTLIEINYGGALFEQGQYQEAEAVFHRANSAYLQQSNHSYYRAIVAQCLGNTLLKQERLTEAASYLQESARLWKECDDELMRANTLGTIAELYMRQGKSDEAARLFDDALTLLAKYPDDAWAKKLKDDFERQR